MEHHPFWHVNETALSNQVTQAHEAAHGWFGNAVRLRCWEDFVLSEGIATYLAARILEEVAGTAVSEPIWQGYRTELEGLTSSQPKTAAWPQSCGAVDILTDGLFSRSPYIKGAFFYQGIEQKLRRAELDEALRTSYERFSGKAAAMRDMLDVIEEVTGFDAAPCAKR